MRAARRDLALPAGRLGLLVAGCGAHPFSAPLGALSIGGRYEETKAEYGIVAELQLVFGLHVHRGWPGGEPLRGSVDPGRGRACQNVQSPAGATSASMLSRIIRSAASASSRSMCATASEGTATSKSRT